MINDAVRFWTKRSISNQKVGFKGSTFKGSEADRLVVLPLMESMVKEKSAKRLTLNREPGTL